MKQDDKINLIPNIESVLVSIIITHYNYSHCVRSALLSVAAQKHQFFECIIVDDCSEHAHLIKLRQIILDLADQRFTLVELQRNEGQTFAVFEGLRHARGEFVSILDPDDLYEPIFIEKMLKCHLNPCVYASVAACEMGLFRVGGAMLSRSYVKFKQNAIEKQELPQYEASLYDFGFSKFYPPETLGWLWGTTSSLMFRRDALEILRRERYMNFTKICADTYCVYGAHLLGGTLFIDELLCWRGIHTANAVEASAIFSSSQTRHQISFVDTSEAIKLFVANTILQNGGIKQLRAEHLLKTLKAHFLPSQLQLLVNENAEFRETLMGNFIGNLSKLPNDTAKLQAMLE